MLKIIHRWLGLIIGLFLVVVSVSGSWLIYHREWQESEFQLVVKPTTLTLEKLYNIAVEASSNSDGMVVRFPQNPEHPYQFWTMGKEQERIFINQYSGEVLATRSSYYWPYGWVFELHTSFLYGSAGEMFLGVIGVCALAVSTVGIALWLPRSPKKISNNFKLRIRKNRYIRNYDLHRHIGILVSPILIVIFFTGASLVFSKEFSQLINWMTQSKVINVNNLIANSTGARVDLDSILAEANRVMPGGRVGIIVVPAENKPIVVRKQMPEDPHANGLNFIYFNASTGKLLETIPISRADSAKKLFNWIYPLHTGQILKDWYYYLLFFLGFIPSILLFTAASTYSIREFKKPRFK